MLTITENAQQKMKDLYTQVGEDADNYLRLVEVGPQKYSFIKDKKNDNDRIVDWDGDRLLIIEDGLSETLDEMTIDFQVTPDGSTFVMYKD